MGFEQRMAQIKEEYKMYKNISDSFKQYDGTMVSIAALEQGKNEGVLSAIYERKQIFEEIINSGDKLDPKKESALADRLYESDLYFYGMQKDTDKKSKAKSFFLNAEENVARTQVFQDYHMIFTALEGIGLSIKADQYASKKKMMQMRKDNFEEQKKKRDDLTKRFLQTYGKEGTSTFIADYLKNADTLKKYTETLDMCAKGKKKGEFILDDIQKEIKNYKSKIKDFEKNNEEKDLAVERLKEGLRKYEENQKKDIDQVIEQKLQGSKEALKKSEGNLAEEKKRLTVFTIGKSPVLIEYVQRTIENYEQQEYDNEMDDKLQELKGKLSGKEIEIWNKRFDDFIEKQKDYFEKKSAFEELKEELEQGKADPNAIIKYSFEFGGGEYNPLGEVDWCKYPEKAKEFIEETEKGRSNRPNELEGYKKSLATAETKETKVKAKLEQINNLEKETKDKHDNLKKIQRERRDDYIQLLNVRSAYKEAYNLAFENPEKLQSINAVPDIQRAAAAFLEKQGLYAGKHDNSPEFNNMINALQIVKNWPNIDAYCNGMPADKKPDSMESAIEYLQKQTKEYKKEKARQFRPFPSALRRTRNAMADKLEEFAVFAKNELEKDKENEMERNNLNAYFESKGNNSEKPEAEKQETKKEVKKDEKQMNEFEFEDVLGR